MDDTTSVPSKTDAVTSADMLAALKAHASEAEAYYDEILHKIKKGDKMTDLTTLAALRNSNDGLGMGGGLMGGLVLGALLRNGNNGLFGNNGNGGDAVLALNPQQAQANMSLMAGIGDIKQAVAVGTAQMETSNALQSSTIQSQLNSVTASLASRVDGVKDVVNGNSVALMQQLNTVNTNLMSAQNTITTAISSDGEKTRALITNQYEATLNRQLSDANAAIIELRSDARQQAVARGVEVTTTNNINQAQSQQQQQLQMQDLRRIVTDLANDLQYIRATNQAINIGTGTQTANPTNTNTNVKA